MLRRAWACAACGVRAALIGAATPARSTARWPTAGWPIAAVGRVDALIVMGMAPLRAALMTPFVACIARVALVAGVGEWVTCEWALATPALTVAAPRVVRAPRRQGSILILHERRSGRVCGGGGATRRCG